MSRSGYSDDCDDQLAHGRWRAQVASATRGKRGQKLFIELAAALDAMPVKELITDELKTEEGGFCTLGVIGAARGLDLERIDPEDPEEVGKHFDIATQLAQEIVYMNDEYFDCMKPHERWLKMREWVASQIKKKESNDPTPP